MQKKLNNCIATRTNIQIYPPFYNFFIYKKNAKCCFMANEKYVYVSVINEAKIHFGPYYLYVLSYLFIIKYYFTMPF